MAKLSAEHLPHFHKKKPNKPNSNNKTNVGRSMKITQIHQNESLSRNVCAYLCSHTEIHKHHFLLFNARSRLQKLKTEKSIKYRIKKWGNIPLLLLSPPTQFPNSSFPPLDPKVQTKQKTLKKGLISSWAYQGLRTCAQEMCSYPREFAGLGVCVPLKPL